MPAPTIICPKCEHSFVPTKVKKPRAQSEYNRFFTSMMKEPEIRALEHKERMPKIGAMWTERKNRLLAAAAPAASSAMEVDEEDELPVGPPLPLKRETTSASVDELTLAERKAAIKEARKKIKQSL